MSVTKKLKWKRSLSRLRFCYDELEYTKESARAAAPEFEAYYRRFCAEKNINISNLDSKNKERLDNLYGRHEITDADTQNNSNIDSTGDTAIVIHTDNPLEDDKNYKMSETI